METLGGMMPAGRPAAVFAGGRTHVFAIAAGGNMNHWTSANGLDWVGPEPLLRGPTNAEPSYPCAIAIGNAVHVFAVNNAPLLANGGPLAHWFSPDGVNFLPPVTDAAWPIPGQGNGIAAASANPNRVDAFAVTPVGLIRYSWSTGYTSLGSAPLPGGAPLPPGNLPRCVPAAVSSAANVTDVFAVGPDNSALRWRTTDGITWRTSVLPRPAGAPAGGLVRGGFAALSAVPNEIELFAVTPNGLLAHWALDGATVREADFLPSPPMSLNESVPVAIAVDGHIEVFAIGQPPDPFTGGPLIRWRRRPRGKWSEAVVIRASLSAGGLGGVAANGRTDVFGLAGNGLQHWPAGIVAATNEPWANWANTQRMAPAGHCRPSSEEEVVAIVRTAERVAGARVRAVGSSWSFPDIAVPSAPGFIVETNEMAGVLTHIIDQEVLIDGAPDAKYLIHVDAGIQVEQLMKTLDRMELAPFTMGGSSGQTLAGVISTSVHGSHWERGPIPNAVRAIQLVGPGGTRYWIEPDQWRITREDELRRRLGPAVQVRYDDDWFDAVLVSMGSMGIITSVVFEVTDKYFLQRNLTRLPWMDLRPQLADNRQFADPDHYLMVAIHPVEPGTNRTCFLVKMRRSAGPADPPAGSFDPLAAFCRLDLGSFLLGFGAAGVAAPVLEAVLSVVAVTAGAFGIPLPAGATLAVAVPVLVAALRAAGPGAIGDFLGTLLNGHPDVASALASYLTESALPAGQVTGLAHKIMAPENPSECAARGLALELAFDATTDAYLTFVDEAIRLLERKRLEGQILPGWFSLRFVGPARAILSPQQSTRTCMIEFVGLRAMTSTAPILNELEQLGRTYGAIQHWGMFGIPNLTAADLPRAYPRLETWKRVRREITNGGAIRTFENAFTARLGLDAAPASAPITWQQDWRWCNRCLGMAFAGGPAGPCAAGGVHDHGASGNYRFAHEMRSEPGQRHWRWCSKCMGMTFQGATAGYCPAGGAHDLGNSGEYTIRRNGQSNWRWCNRCQCLTFAGAAPGPCPAGGTHDYTGSGDYWLPYAPSVETELPTRPGRPPRRFRVERPSLEVVGEHGWRLCSQCQGFSQPGGRCSTGGAHAHGTSSAYIVAMNAPTVSGQPHWRKCSKCQTLAFRGGRCFAGDSHDLRGSDDYTVRDNAGQNAWRYCRNCQGLWFSGNGGLGRCPSPAGVHDLGPDDYWI